MADNEQNQNVDTLARVLWNNMIPAIREQAGDIAGRFAQGAVRTATNDEAIAHKARDVVDLGLQVSATVAANVKDFVSATSTPRHQFSELQRDVAPYLKAEFGKSNRRKLMRSSNEVIQVQRKKVFQGAKYGIYQASAGLLDKLPDAYSFMGEKHQKVKGRGSSGDGVSADSGIDLDDVIKVLPSEGAKRVDEAKAKVDGTIEKAAASAVFDPENKKLIDAALRSVPAGVQQHIESEGEQRLSKVTAFDMIKQLSEQANSGNGRLDTVYFGNDPLLLEDFVLQVFKQHQQDVNGAPVNERFRSMPEMKEACSAIAAEINDNMLDPMALVTLVGDRKILDKEMRVASPDEVKAALQEAGLVTERGANVNAEEFIAETAFGTKEDFQEVLGQVPDEDRAFFCSLFPTSVLKDLGEMKDSEIDAMKEKGADEFSEKIIQAITEIGSMEDQELEHTGVTAEEATLLKHLAEAVNQMGGEQVAGELQGEMREGVTEAVRNATGFWEGRVKKKSAVGPEKDEVPGKSDGEGFAASVEKRRDQSSPETELGK